MLRGRWETTSATPRDDNREVTYRGPWGAPVTKTTGKGCEGPQRCPQRGPRVRLRPSGRRIGPVERRLKHYSTDCSACRRPCTTANRSPVRPGADNITVTRGRPRSSDFQLRLRGGYVFTSGRVKNCRPLPLTASHSPGEPASGSAKPKTPPMWTV